jgi:hypothetical protein
MRPLSSFQLKKLKINSDPLLPNYFSFSIFLESSKEPAIKAGSSMRLENFSLLLPLLNA